MKKLLYCALLLIHVSVFAQEYKIESSEVIEITEYSTRILQLQNNKTILFEATKKDGMLVSAFSADRK